jgi:tetratricopeptide (TPR) repeat protein
MNSISSITSVMLSISGAIFALVFAQRLVSKTSLRDGGSSVSAERKRNRINLTVFGNPTQKDLERAILKVVRSEDNKPDGVSRIIDTFLTELRPRERNDEELLIELAEKLRTWGRYDEAILSLDQALNANPRHHGAWFQRGLTLGELQRFSESIISYRNAVRNKPDYVDAIINLGILFANQHRIEEALDAFDRVLEIDPQNYIAIQFRQLLASGTST